ncbi:Chaperone protein DnaK [Orchesella cincta]|uniref:Chaperone protein DnaK n=1 Tax=Orchesella cincta TaxID=48709 RepID=A0A1D2NGR5_ORCCI|nr:Chaperone protein DnaK [Orchesella cincta]
MGANSASSDLKSLPSLTTWERKEKAKGSCMPRDDKKHFPEQKSRLNPLIFHLSLNHVRVGIEHESRFLQLPPVPAVVGITSENQWVCGEDDRLKEESTKVWLIRECNRPWHEQVRIGDNVNDITVEFLLGFLLGALKEHVEEMCNGEISQAIFIIPFWFTSSQRQQVKDSGTIAGFTENLLINENSALAFKAINGCNESSDIVVLSENSGHVDVTVYAYDKQKENLKMRGHYAVYEKKEKQRKQRPSMLSLEYLKFLTFGAEVSDSTGNAVHEAYKLAKNRLTLGKGSGSKSRPKIISSVLNLKIGRTYLCGQRKELLKKHIFLRNPISYEKTVQDNYNALPLNDAKLIISSDLPMYVSKARFYQKGVNGEAVIGDLNVKDSMDDICVKLEINNEGIVSLHCVNAKNRYSVRTRGGSERITLDSSLYSWTCPNLNPDQIGSYASLLEYFKEAKKASKVSSETEQAKQGLNEKGEELIQRIENKEGKFRSDLGRNMVKGQITEALGLLSHPKITPSDIEKQMDLFQKLEAKYFPQ